MEDESQLKSMCMSHQQSSYLGLKCCTFKEAFRVTLKRKIAESKHRSQSFLYPNGSLQKNGQSWEVVQTGGGGG